MTRLHLADDLLYRLQYRTSRLMLLLLLILVLLLPCLLITGLFF